MSNGEGLKALLDRAQAGDASSLPEVRKLLANPGAVDLLGGNLARDVRETLICKYAGKNHMVREALLRKMEALRAEVAGPDPSPLERLLIDRIVSCWLFLHHLEALYAQKDSMALSLTEYYLRNIQRAQKSYLAAIKTLAAVRRLATPAVQVNIARRQVNVLAPPAADDGTPEGHPARASTVGAARNGNATSAPAVRS